MTAVRKLVVWDEGWVPWADEFAGRLGAAWRVSAGATNTNWLLREMKGADALLAVRMPEEVLPLAGNLEAFLFPGAGVLHTDPAGYPKGCRVVNVYEHEAPIAEYVLMAMLMHVTEFRARAASFAEGRWEGGGRVGGVPHGELGGRTVGIFGYGRIGRAIATRAKAFGMRVAAATRSAIPGDAVQPDFAGSVEEVLEQSDFLVIAAPLTTETRGRIGAAELAMLPPGAVVINVSRAEIVAEQALFDALSEGRLGGAALDVWYQYPAPGESGYGSALPFHTLPNVICTPHYSAWTRAMILRRIDAMCANLKRLERGEALERVVLTGSWEA